MDIELFTAPTPNGHKVSIMLEELGITYKCTSIDLASLQQKQDWYLRINPNGESSASIL